MPSEQVHEVAVLVVGAGPAGLTTAATLAHQGVESLVVERRRELSSLPRATVISTRSMELLRAWDLEPEIRDGGTEAEWLLWVCETLARSDAGHALPVGLPTRDQSSLISPTSPACVPQDHLELVLLRHVRSLGPSRVDLGHEVIEIEPRDDAVRVVVQEIATGTTRRIEAQYLVAADGAHSTVRQALGIPMRGPDHLHEAVSTLFRAPLWSLVERHPSFLYSVTNPEAVGSFLPAGRSDRWIYATSWDPERESIDDLSEERMTRNIRLGAGVDDLDPRIERIGTFEFAGKLADRFTEGRTFLIGDAAHRVTPRGGTGMNTAMHDGYDLGWKLAWVLRGWGRPDLLDTYETERRPFAEHNVARSIEPDGSIRDLGAELPADLGGRIPHLWVPSRRDPTSTLDLIGPGLTVLTGPESAAWETAAASAGTRVPVVVEVLDAVTARALGIHGRGALMVRPDGSPAGWWPHGTDARSALRPAVDRVAAGTAPPVVAAA